MNVQNHDIVNLVEKLDRFSREIKMSQSAHVSQLGGADRERLDSYLAALEYLVAWIAKMPALDLPESHPRGYEVSEVSAVVLDEVENEHIKVILRLFDLARYELIKSQSSRLASGLIGFDHKRFIASVDKVKAFLVEFVDMATPLDLPESSPKAV